MTQPRQRQLVDPFVVAKPPPAQPRPVHHAPDASRLAVPQQHRPASAVDGMLITRPAARQTPVSRPLPKGPLHLQYRTRPTPRPDVVPVSRPATSRPRPQTPQPVNESVTEDFPTLRPKPTNPGQPRRKKALKFSVWAIVGMVVIGGLSLFSQAFGEAALAVYAIVALWRRWPSQQTFALALAMFGGIIISSLLSSLNVPQFDSLQQIAENLAVYAFLLLCIGTVALAREVRGDAHQTSAG